MKNLFIHKYATISETLKQIDKSGQRHLIVTEKNNKLLGVIADGDLRRAILKKKKLSSKITNIFNKKPLFFYENDLLIKIAKRRMEEKGIFFAPIVNKKKTVVNFLNIIDNSSKKNTKKTKDRYPILIMAGGKGKRLEPFTSILPKPLIPINDRTIIENIIDTFTENNLNNFFISINFKGKIIESYFDDLKKNYKIKFVREKKPLGTAGAIKFIRNQVKSNFFVTNSDIILNIDYNDLIEFHKKNKNIITVVVAAKEYIIPYGSCEINQKGYLVKIKEKPSYNFLVSTGLYLFNKKIFKLIKKNEKLEMDKLIETAIKNDCKIMVYPTTEKSWIDVGQWDEYKKALEKLSFN